MFNVIRNSLKTNISKFIIILIALTLLIFYLGEITKKGSDIDVAKLSKLGNISFQEFDRAKKNTINFINQNSGQNLPLENFSSKEFNAEILKNLINKKILTKLIRDYGIIVSDKTLADYIRNAPEFRDDNGKFNLYVFKNFLSKLYITEKEFYEELKFAIGKKLLEKILLSSVQMPKIYSQNIINFAATSSNIDILQARIDLLRGPTKLLTPQDSDLKKFYDENQSEFLIKATKEVKYINILTQRILPSSLVKASKEEKIKFLSEEISKLEDLIASGETLEAIASKYKISISAFKGSLDDFLANPLLSKFSDKIFSMQKGEVSYPAETETGENILVFNLIAETKEKIAEYNSVKTQILSKYHTKQLVENAKKTLQDFAAKAKYESIGRIAKENGLQYKNTVIARNITTKDIPDEVVAKILSSRTGEIIGPIFVNNIGYIARVNKVYIDKAQVDSLGKVLTSNLSNSFALSVINDIIFYYYKQANPEIMGSLIGLD